MTTSSIPSCRRQWRWRSSSDRPLNRSRHLGRSLLSLPNRCPLPAANINAFMGCSGCAPLKPASKTEIGDSVFHSRDKTQEGSHLDIRDILQGEGNAPFTSPQGCDPMVQFIAVEYHQGTGSQCQRMGLGLMISIIAVKLILILKPASRLIDKTHQDGITPSLVIRGVVMPTHVVLRFRVIIKRIGMGITYRTEEQIPLGE